MELIDRRLINDHGSVQLSIIVIADMLRNASRINQLEDFETDVQEHSYELTGVPASSLPHATQSFPNDTTTTEGLLPQGAIVTIYLFYACAFVLTVVGNSVSILVFTRGRRSKTDVRMFLINLAIADLVMGVVCLPISSLSTYLGWILPEFMCPVVQFLQHTSVNASVYINTALSIDRFLAVKYPFKRLTVSRSRVTAIVGIVWLASAALSSVQLAVSRVQDDGSGGRQCTEIWDDIDFKKYYSVIVLLSTYAVPTCLVVVMYSLVCHQLWQRQSPGAADRDRDGRQLKVKRKVVKMLIAVGALFIASWLPLHLFFILLDFCPQALNYPQDERLAVILYYSVHLLAISNSFQNPIIYGFLNDNFRSDLAELLVQCCSLLAYIPAIKKAASRRPSTTSLGMRISTKRRNALRLRSLYEPNGDSVCSSQVLGSCEFPLPRSVRRDSVKTIRSLLSSTLHSTAACYQKHPPAAYLNGTTPKDKELQSAVRSNSVRAAVRITLSKEGSKLDINTNENGVMHDCSTIDEVSETTSFIRS